jgi:hypothetical protein
MICITGLACLMRPLWLFMPLVLWSSTRLQGHTPGGSWRLAATQLGAVLVIAPWIWYASAVAGRMVPVALNGGMNLWIGNNPQATGGYIAPPSEFWDPRNDARAQREAIEYMLHHPLRVIELIPTKIWLSFDREPWPEWVFGATAVPTAPEIVERVRWLANIVYWLTLALSIGSISMLVRTKQSRLLAPLILLVYSVATQIPFFGTPRFRWTTQFLLIIYASAFPVLLRLRTAQTSSIAPHSTKRHISS